jgi:L-lactate dehydrogenase complex protein LldG
MSDARAAILLRVRQAQRTARLPEPTHDAHYAPSSFAGDERLRRFEAELHALGVACHVEASAADVRARVAALITGKRVLAWSAGALPYELGGIVAGAARGSDDRELQASADVGVSGCEAAIAETGSIAVLSGQGCSRTVSLLPPSHVAIVRADQLLSSMAEFFERHAARIDAAACCTFITGPSRTADIELQLTLGVHGPGQVTIVVGP